MSAGEARPGGPQGLHDRLYLLSPEDLGAPARPFEAGLVAFERLLADVPAAACLLRTTLLDEAQAAEALARTMRATEAGGTAVLVDRLDLARQCDGLHLDWEPSAVAAARQALGAERQLGVLVPAERHAAMEAAEAGADYVAFSVQAPGDLELLAWWQEIAVVPAVAFDPADSELAKAAEAADFLALGQLLWRDGAAARQVLEALD